MNYNIFISKMNLLGKKFSTSKYKKEYLPTFYNFYDPIDVFIEVNGMYINLLSIDEIDDFSKMYFDDDRIVVAVINGDPIFIYNNAIWRCSHDNLKEKPELLFKTFDDFLEYLQINGGE